MDTILITLAGGVISSLAGAVVVLWKKNNELQDKRLEDQKEINNKIVPSLSEVADVTKAIYDALPGKKRSK